MDTYRIVRVYFDDHPRRVLKQGLTIEQAHEHCGDKETSSSTCTTPMQLAHTKNHGPWFDAFESE